MTRPTGSAHRIGSHRASPKTTAAKIVLRKTTAVKTARPAPVASSEPSPIAAHDGISYHPDNDAANR